MRAVVFLLLLAPALAWGHAGSKSWLTLQVNGAQVEGRLTASLADVALALGLDIRETPQSLRPQVAARREEVLAYAARGLVVLVNGERGALQFGRLLDGQHNGEEVLVLELRASAPAPVDGLDVGYTLFFEDDVLHECLARIEWDGGTPSEAVFRLGEPFRHLQRGEGASAGFLQFLRSGAWHIWTGYDHVLFLLALLLPAVLLPARRAWVAAPDLTAALLRAGAIVTAFTVAHSVTLAAASLGWIGLPERVVESAIAVSVFIAAISNFMPAIAAAFGPWMAFAFGLLHGFGFASVLAGLVSRSAEAWRPLLAFNLGVELGQFAIVALFFPLAWAVRTKRFYRSGVVRAGSALVCASAVVWFVARAS